jgi:sucrose-6-phosphate hydrolase SacC (GH32 family)
MAFFSSKDLKKWEVQSELKCFFECPELFELPVDGNNDQTKWVLYGGSGDYYVGEFDGKEYKPDGEAIPFNHGDCFYASQTFSDVPPEDGRRIQIAWGRTGHKDMPFNQMMDFPVELTLRDTADGPRMFAWPVKEIEVLHKKTHRWKDLNAEEATRVLKEVQGDLFDMTLVLEPSDAGIFDIVVRGLKIQYDSSKQLLRCKDKTASLKAEEGRIALRLLVDRLSVEIFGNNGLLYMPMSNVCDEEKAGIEVYEKNEQVKIIELTVNELNSAWERGKQGAYATAAK